MSDFKTSIVVNASAQQSFKCINDVTKWWTENLDGSTQKTGDEFTVQFGEVHYSKQKIAELIPGKKVVWLVTESNLSFVGNKQEWTNSMIVFDIDTHDNKTQIHFTHLGLTPACECFDACSNAWSQYIQQSLLSLVNTGEGQPTRKEIPV